MKFVNNTDQFIKAMERGEVQGLQVGSQLLSTNIRKFTPVLTGFLRSKTEADENVQDTGSGKKITVRNNTEYGPFQEYGTALIQPRAMFRRGGEASRESIMSIIQKNLPK